MYLLGLRRINGANRIAGATVNAKGFIDHILAIAGGNAGDGALCFAGAAANAIVVDFVSQKNAPP